MKIVGIIAEYNPLHNGHLYHINKIKEAEKPDLIIGVVSSSFTMRGDLSIYDKFTKTRQALELGLDIVIENPMAYTIERADIYAKNAIDILNICNVDSIYVGSEENDILKYEKIYKENKELEKNNKLSLKENANLDLLSNDILGYFYYKRIKDMNYDIKVNLIKRIDNNYNDKNLSNTNISSATSIRLNLNKIKDYTPKFTHKDINNILDENKLFKFIKYNILNLSISELKNIFFVDEGIENKLKDVINYKKLDDFIDYLSNKKYTKTRIKRMLVYILFNIKKDEINKIYQDDINFIRVLGYSKYGKKYLSKNKKKINIYTNIKEGLNDVLDIEFKISRILDFIYNTNLIELEQKGPITIK